MPVRDKKLVVCTPSGRSQYMKVLAPRILSDPDIDRWDIWLNTDVHADVIYLNELSKHPKIRLVTLPEPVYHPVAFRIHKFFPHACEIDTVYVRLDDDIVYYHPRSVSQLAEYRLDHPHPFLVYGNVVNTAKTSYLHQRLGRIPIDRGICGDNDCMDSVGWGNPQFAAALHRDFLNNPSPETWELDDILLDHVRHSINVISWTGEDCAKWAHTMHQDEEAWLAYEEPVRTNRPNMIAGSCGPFVHYAFYSQRNGFGDNLLSEYAALPIYRSPWERLDAVVKVIKSVSKKFLTDPVWLANLISCVGLFNDDRPLYGVWNDSQAKLQEPALWQHPEEFARFLVWCSDKEIQSVLELGTFYGFLSVIMEAYLRRFVPLVTYTSADWHRWIPYTPSKFIDYRPNTHSGHYEGRSYDLVFIDADHSYVASSTDYARLKHCKIIAFHDINDQQIRGLPDGGVPRLWNEIKSTRPSIEFLRSDGQPWMGIGVLFSDSTRV